jgi:hypothetical protein
MPAGFWRTDLNALSFQPPAHGGECLVHRGALRTLLGFNPSPADCERWFAGHLGALYRAAAAKISRARLPSHARFHLTSRDISRVQEQIVSSN